MSNAKLTTKYTGNDVLNHKETWRQMQLTGHFHIWPLSENEPQYRLVWRLCGFYNRSERDVVTFTFWSPYFRKNSLSTVSSERCVDHKLVWTRWRKAAILLGTPIWQPSPQEFTLLITVPYLVSTQNVAH